MATIPVLPRAIPGRPPMPLLGWRGGLMSFYRDPIAEMTRSYRVYGPVAAMVRNSPAPVYAFGPAYNRLLLSDTETFLSSPFGNIPVPHGSAAYKLRQGLLSLNGGKHKQHRRLMMPAFHRKHVQLYSDEMVAIARRHLDGWRPGETRDIAAAMHQLTLDIALKTLFGLEAGPQADALAARIRGLLTNISALSTMLLPYDVPGSTYGAAMRTAERVAVEIQKLVDRRRSSADGAHDLLSALIEAHDEDGTRLSDDELLGHTYTIFIAGHETTANALTWTLFLLAQHPAIVADLVDELDGALGGEAPSLSQLGELPLLDQVIKESMRLLPPAALATRHTVAPAQVGPYEVAAGTTLIYSHYVTQHLPELYAEPQRFRPRRWEQLDPSPYEYLPFGAGARMCIGATFALTEMKLVLPMVLQRFRLTVAPGARVDRRFVLTLAPKHGMPMHVAAQDRRFERSEVIGNIHEMVDLS